MRCRATGARVDEAGFVWVMLHSGSRGVGKLIGMMFIELANSRGLIAAL